MRIAMFSVGLGFCLITFGFYEAYHPLGYIVSGLMLILAATRKRSE
jgi:hypothetical protein